MKRLLVAAAVVSGSVVVGTGAAGADPTSNAHNCQGNAVTGFSGPGFGQQVNFFAHTQQVDDFSTGDEGFGFGGNCSDNNSNNP